MRWALGVEYDGTQYCGWQSQPGLRSVEGDLALAIASVADHDVDIVCGGRTDAGVHAAGQVVHFDTHAKRSMYAWMQGVNANLGEFVSVCWARPVENFFHARYSALRRHYRYTIFNRRARSALAARAQLNPGRGVLALGLQVRSQEYEHLPLGVAAACVPLLSYARETIGGALAARRQRKR